MNRQNRFVIAVAVSIVLMLIAAGAWAAPKFQGTVPPVPDSPVIGNCLETVNMGTAIFTVQPPDCMKVVEWIKDPTKDKYPSPPRDVVFLGHTFVVTTEPKDAIVQVCYAYPPELAEKNGKIYRLNEDAEPPVWVEIPGAQIGNGTICVNSAAGVFTLTGNP
jgi:hypothetical protein